MRRRPNPWVAIPVAVATLIGGVVGALIMQLSCAPGSCPVAAAGVGLLSAAIAFAGVAVVTVLAVRSIREWQEAPKPAPRPPDEGSRRPPTC
jgi:hypothetical protein